MGKEYALRSGEVIDVATAIYEHYLPIQAGGDLPSTDAGAIVSMADKLDTICGCFGVGLIPTGAADPYALRRQALGIIFIIMDKSDKKERFNLETFIDKSLECLEGKLARNKAAVKARWSSSLRKDSVTSCSCRISPTIQSRRFFPLTGSTFGTRQRGFQPLKNSKDTPRAKAL